MTKNLKAEKINESVNYKRKGTKKKQREKNFKNNKWKQETWNSLKNVFFILKKLKMNILFSFALQFLFLLLQRQ